MKNIKLLKIAFLIFVFFLTACSRVVLHQDLKENDANEILVALHDRGIEAKKTREEKSSNVSWSIEVLPKDEPLARKILVDNKLPKVKQPGFSEICGQKSIISSPEEDKCRKLLAMKGEIINSLQDIPGVIEATVVLNTPTVDQFAVESQPDKRPSASVTIRVRKNADGTDLTEAKIQRFISNAVEGLDPRDVAVVISYEGNPNLIVPVEKNVNFVSYMGLQISPESKNRFKIYSLCMLGVFVFLSGALIFAIFRLMQMRQKFSGNFDASGKGENDSKYLLSPESSDVPLISESTSSNSRP